MERCLTAESYIVHVYRADTEDLRKIDGIVEIIDGSGRREPFRSADELVTMLTGGACACGKKVRKDRRKNRQ